MTTAQQMADYWAYQVMVGRGQWLARLCPRGLAGAVESGMPLVLAPPPDGETHDVDSKTVFAQARVG